MGFNSGFKGLNKNGFNTKPNTCRSRAIRFVSSRSSIWFSVWNWLFSLGFDAGCQWTQTNTGTVLTFDNGQLPSHPFQLTILRYGQCNLQTTTDEVRSLPVQQNFIPADYPKIRSVQLADNHWRSSILTCATELYSSFPIEVGIGQKWRPLNIKI